jgi:hypothetical protein
MPYGTPADLRRALEARLSNESRDRGVTLDRLRKRVVFERILVRLSLGSPGGWIVKGGMALELRTASGARSTRDLDLASRLVVQDGDELRDRLIAVLGEDAESDAFEFRIGPATPIAPDQAGRPGWRFAVETRLAGRVFEQVRIDIVLRPEEIASTELLRIPNALAFAGYPFHDVEVVDPPQQFAEKLHALSRTYGRDNTRTHDLADLVFIIEQGWVTPGPVLDAVRVVFAARTTHEMPLVIVDPPTFWSDRYAELGAEMALEAATLEAAMALVRAFWADVVALEGENQ